MSKYNKSKIMIHAWNIVRCAKRNNKVVYIATAMRKAWAYAKKQPVFQKVETTAKVVILTRNNCKFIKETEKARQYLIVFKVWCDFAKAYRPANIETWIPKSAMSQGGQDTFVLNAWFSQNLRYEVASFGNFN